MNANHLPILAVMAAGVLWSTSGVIGESSSLPPLALTELRLVSASAALSIVLGPSRLAQLIRRTDWKLLLIASLGMAAYQWCFFAAVKDVGASFATWATVVTGPLWAMVISRVWSAEPSAIGRSDLWLTAATLLGLILMGANGEISGTGIAVSLIGGLAYAVYASATSRMDGGQSESAGADTALAVTTVALGGAGVLLLPLAWGAISTGAAIHWQASDFAKLAFLGLSSTAYAYFLFARGTSQMGARRALAFQWIQPVATEVLIPLSPDHFPGPAYVWGMALLCVSMLVSSILGLSRQPRFLNPTTALKEQS